MLGLLNRGVDVFLQLPPGFAIRWEDLLHCHNDQTVVAGTDPGMRARRTASTEFTNWRMFFPTIRLGTHADAQPESDTMGFNFLVVRKIHTDRISSLG